MWGRQHLTLGLATGVTVGISTMGVSTETLFFASMCTIGSLFPDIDIDSSMVGDVFKPVARVIHAKFGHRGFVHSFLCMDLLTLLFYAVMRWMNLPYAPAMALGFFVGYLGHLVQDTFTRHGVPLLYPIKFNFHLTNVLSSNPICWLFTFALYGGVWKVLHDKPGFFLTAGARIIQAMNTVIAWRPTIAPELAGRAAVTFGNLSFLFSIH